MLIALSNWLYCATLCGSVVTVTCFENWQWLVLKTDLFWKMTVTCFENWQWLVLKTDSDLFWKLTVTCFENWLTCFEKWQWHVLKTEWLVLKTDSGLFWTPAVAAKTSWMHFRYDYFWMFRSTKVRHQEVSCRIQACVVIVFITINITTVYFIYWYMFRNFCAIFSEFYFRALLRYINS